MGCYLCGGDNPEKVFSVKYDKYQSIIGSKTRRHWEKCCYCGLFYQRNDLTDTDLKDIYLNYRDREMRGTTVKEEFERIKNIPDSENKKRVDLLLKDGELYERTTLDIGSGLGIFPDSIREYTKHIQCIEPDKESSDFIINELKLNCYNGFYTGIDKKVSFITLVHVLEHQRDPVGFLVKIKDNCEGTLYIEVPDSCEFDYLQMDHDEFNSTHLFMFDVSTLDKILRNAGFEPYLIRRLKYKDRNLSRITMLARPIGD